jgi:signal transduction histidine kinase
VNRSFAVRTPARASQPARTDDPSAGMDGSRHHMLVRWALNEPLLRAAPFAAVAVAGQVSSAWPPGPSDARDFWFSTALLFASAVVLIRPAKVKPHSVLLAACLYVASVTFLMFANGGIGSGFGPLFFVAVVGVALYGRRTDSVAVVGLVIVGLFMASMATSPHDAASTARRIALLGAISAVLSLSIHALRDRLVESNRRTTNLLHQAESINAAARRLASLLEPPAIAALGAELAAQVATPPGSALSRARYLLVQDGAVTVEAQHGGADEIETQEPGSLEERSPLARAVRTLEPVAGRLSTGGFERTVPSARTEGARTNAAWVPVCIGGTLHGVLEVVSAGAPVTLDSLERCVALGHLLELALSNWAAHEELERQATTEERRRIARDLHDGLAHELAFIASKARGASGHSTTASDSRELASAADRALDEARRAITVLSATRPESLASAVTQTAEDLGSRLGVPVLIDLVDDIEISGKQTEQVLRIVREAITNAAVHGRPNFVTVSLRNDEDSIRLVVSDDGCGFDPAATGGPGFGLVSMRERTASIGGDFALHSAPAQGTRIEVMLP